MSNHTARPPVDQSLARTVAFLAATAAIGLNAAAVVLMRQFDFPGILRRPALDALTLFAQHSATVIPAYYTFALASLALIPLAVLTRSLLRNPESSLLTLATTLGVLAGLTQALGFLRWPLMEPALVRLYFDAAASTATRDAVLVVHETMNRYAGVAIGEHLGWLLTGSWLATLGVYVIRRPSVWLPRAAGAIILFCGVATLVSSAEQFGVHSALVDASLYAGYVLWTVLLAVWAIALVMQSRRRAS